MASTHALDNSSPPTHQSMANSETPRSGFAEFQRSVTEVLRVLSIRRWRFLIPFCLTTSAAFVVSLSVPRRYFAFTTFERRDDPVLINLPHQPADQTLRMLHRELTQDIKKADTLWPVAFRALHAQDDQPPVADAESLGTDERNTVTREANRIGGGLDILVRHVNENLDAIEIDLTLGNPSGMHSILSDVRDLYISMARDRINEALRTTRAYFQEEADKRQTSVDSLEDDLTRFKAEHRGLDPLNPNAPFNELTSLRGELAMLERKSKDLETQLNGRKNVLERYQNAGPATQRANRPMGFEAPHPFKSSQAKRIEDEIQNLTTRMEELQTTRRMTRQHPEVAALRHKIEAAEKGLERQRLEDQRIVSANGAAALMDPSDEPTAEAAAFLAERATAETEVKTFEQLLADNESEIKRVMFQIAELNTLHQEALWRQKEFRRREQDVARAQQELMLFKGHIDDLSRILSAQDNEKGVRFESIKAATGSSVPVTPRLASVLALSLLAGFAVGAVLVLICELFDRTIRTRQQVFAALGLPVLESIDEILSSAGRRKALFKKLVLVPSLSTALFAMVALSGSAAYLSLRNKALYEQVVDVSRQAIERITQVWSPREPVAQAGLAHDGGIDPWGG